MNLPFFLSPSLPLSLSHFSLSFSNEAAKKKNHVQSLFNLKICNVRYSHVTSFKFLTVLYI